MVFSYFEGYNYAYCRVCTRVFLNYLNDENMTFVAIKYREFLKVRKVK